MVTAVEIITSLVSILLIGLVVSLLAKRFDLPDALFLILAGLVIAVVAKMGYGNFDFPQVFLNATAVLALALVVFEGATNIRLRQLDQYGTRSLPLTLGFICAVLVLFTTVSMVVLDVPFSAALFFASLVAGSSSDIMTTMFSKLKEPVVEILKFESIINTPIVVIIPFVIADVLSSVQSDAITILSIVQPFLLKIVAGVGAGAVLFVLVYKIVNFKYSSVYTPLSVVVSALLAYVLAENIGGDGVLSVTTLGLLFGNFIRKKKTELTQVESVFSKALYLLIFILIGLVIETPTSTQFWVQSLVLFAAYIIIRFSACMVLLDRSKFTWRRKLFASLQSTKGIATATLVLTFAVVGAPITNLAMVLNLALVFILYSLLLSTITLKLSPWFFND